MPPLRESSSRAGACGLRGPSSFSPAPAALCSGRLCRPCGLEPHVRLRRGEECAGLPRRSARPPHPSSPQPRLAFADRPRGAVAALVKGLGTIPALPYVANGVASGAGIPLRPRSTFAFCFQVSLRRCSGSGRLTVNPVRRWASLTSRSRKHDGRHLGPTFEPASFQRKVITVCLKIRSARISHGLRIGGRHFERKKGLLFRNSCHHSKLSAVCCS